MTEPLALWPYRYTGPLLTVRIEAESIDPTNGYEHTLEMRSPLTKADEYRSTHGNHDTYDAAMLERARERMILPDNARLVFLACDGSVEYGVGLRMSMTYRVVVDR